MEKFEVMKREWREGRCCIEPMDEVADIAKVVDDVDVADVVNVVNVVI